MNPNISDNVEQKSDTASSKQPPVVPPGWNDPPLLPPTQSKPGGRLSLTRRVGFPISSTSQVLTLSENDDVALETVVTNFKNALIDRYEGEENSPLKLNKIDELKLHWKDNCCSRALKCDLFQISQHLLKRDVRKAYLLYHQLTLNPELNWFSDFAFEIVQYF